MASYLIDYGEDALTLWALTSKRSQVLELLDDDSRASECMLFYRPSFGRGRNSFGEFDAILATPQMIYLVESKWHESSEFRKRESAVRLSDVQVRRHKIFRWYLSHRRDASMQSWSDFRECYSSEFGRRFGPKSIPSDKSKLGQNLRYTLTKLGGFGGQVRDICLYFKMPGQTEPDRIDSGEFELFVMEFEALTETGIFKMA